MVSVSVVCNIVLELKLINNCCRLTSQVVINYTVEVRWIFLLMQIKHKNKWTDSRHSVVFLLIINVILACVNCDISGKK